MTVQGPRHERGVADNQLAPPAGDVAYDERLVPAHRELRVFQFLAAAAGVVLFLFGLVAVFRVDFGAHFLTTSAEVLNVAFSPAAAIAAIVLGAIIMVTTLADQDRSSAAVAGMVTLLVGIAALVLAEQKSASYSVAKSTAVLFVVIGAVVFVLSLVPWWSSRRRTTVTRRGY
jgi:predicted anti-sigma-YlaC factor YlaD